MMTSSPLLRGLALAAGLAFATGSLAGCEEKGPAEQLGQRIDESAGKAGEKMEDAGDTVKDATN
jgi:hypothetical protein